MPILRRCTKCSRRLPATREHFYVFWRKKPHLLRPMCKDCCRKAHRAYIRAHPQKDHEYNQRDYRKHSRKRIDDEMGRYWNMKKDAHRHAAYLKQRRVAEARRMMNPEYAERRRKQKAAVDAKRIRF